MTDHLLAQKKKKKKKKKKNNSFVISLKQKKYHTGLSCLTLIYRNVSREFT